MEITVLTDFLGAFFIVAAIAFLILAAQFCKLEKRMHSLQSALEASMAAKAALQVFLKESRQREIDLQVALDQCRSGK